MSVAYLGSLVFGGPSHRRLILEYNCGVIYPCGSGVVCGEIPAVSGAAGWWIGIFEAVGQRQLFIDGLVGNTGERK